MKRRALLQTAVVGALASFLTTLPARADEPIRIGLIAPFSGPFAEYGKQMEGGIKAYQKLHGTTAGGRRVDILMKDTTGPVPEIAKRLAQELVVRDKVDFLAGFCLTPEALAVTPIAQQAKVPMVVFNAASSSITTKSDYVTRVSMTLPQMSSPMATWALKNGIKQVAIVVADYAPGIDAEHAFRQTFTAGGGQVVEAVRVPLRNPEFAPFIQRVKDAKPQAVFVFLPAGEQGVAFMKSFRDRSLAQAGIKLIATGDLTDDNVLPAMGDATLGVITAFHYSAAHDSPQNRTFLKAFADANPGAGRPNFMAVAAYDGIGAIYDVINKLGGRMDGTKAMALFKGMKIDSPRGPVLIDPATRDVVQTVYIRRVEKVGGELYNVEFDKFADVKDPGK
ncbi:ABC transporter substrate-binding protein [Ralstonia syzygii]|uniref:ABC transporter substrate-binding protein n=1 Tax=Ralstonia syzygii TaxID=28097 RepID=UPI0018CFF640|nr:ABC transporter substrate-binding protein [Ralstonia syzygii]